MLDLDLLLILAVAGGVFAQEFSWSGGVDINGKIDFRGEDVFNHEGIVGQDPDGTTGGHVDLEYTNGGLTLGMGFAAKYWDADDANGISSGSIGLSAGYTGENFGLKVEMDLFGVTWKDGNATLGDVMILSDGPTTLWGFYTFMDEALRFDVSYAGGGNGIWAVSDLVLEEFRDDWNVVDGGGFQFTYTGIEGVSFGVMFPFDFEALVSPGMNKTFGGYTILHSVWGVTYEVDPLAVSLMLMLSPKTEIIPPYDLTGVLVDLHFGFGFKISEEMALSADLVFGNGSRWGLGGDFTTTPVTLPSIFNDDFYMAAGLKFDYEAAPLNAGIALLFHDVTDKYLNNNDWGGMALEINPYAGYWFIEEVLQGTLDIDVVIGLGDNETKTLEISPGILYNVDPNASISIGYTMGFDLDAKELDTNAITLGFTWSF